MRHAVSGLLAFTILLGTLVVAPVVHAGSVRLLGSIDGVRFIDETKTGTSFLNSANVSINATSLSTLGLVMQGGNVGAKAATSGVANADTRSTATSNANFQLVPPQGANFAGGTLVIVSALNGELSGTAHMELAVEIEAFTVEWEAKGSDKRRLDVQPGPEGVEFEVRVQLPSTLDPARKINVTPNLVLDAVASIAAGVNARSSAAETPKGGIGVVGFRVLDAAGSQVTGFTLGGSGKNVPEQVPPPIGLGLAVEYYHAVFGHYFITSLADEIDKLDSGVFPGWTRTGQSFKVYRVGGSGRVAVCRFFSTAFSPRSSHFYAPRGLGCEAVLENPSWQFEGDVFFTFLPDAQGVCPDDNLPVFRLYNNGQGGAPNHRFTTSEAIRNEMIDEGYVAEGNGIGVGMCSPR